jgi:YHS domain-containing protein/thioredoxin-like negative regulator of GroEL
MSRRIFAIAIAVLAATTSATASAADSAVRWQSDIEAALAQASQSNRLVLLHFWGTNCRPCIQLDNSVFKEPQFAAVLEADYVPVKINADQFPVTAQRYGVRSWPTDVVLTPDGKVAATMQCPADGPTYARKLRETASSFRRPTAQIADGNRQMPAASGYAANGYNANGYAANGYAASRESAASYAPREDYRQAPPVTAVESRQPAAEGFDRRYANDASSQSQPAQSAPTYQSRNNFADAPKAGTATMTTRDTTPATAVASQDKSGLPYGNPAPTASTNRAPPAYTAADARAGGVAAPSSAATPSNTPPSNTPPSLCLDGHCPVTLIETGKWIFGDRRYGATHRGRLYLFTSSATQQRFLADPDRYGPAVSGHDAVVWLEQGRLVRGEIKFGGVHNGIVYLFSNEDSFRKFETNPDHYAAPAQQALATGRGQGQIRR